MKTVLLHLEFYISSVLRLHRGVVGVCPGK